ncbi:MAG: hypothetical protein R3B68_03885 [Phycisphaerales bacterium]
MRLLSTRHGLSLGWGLAVGALAAECSWLLAEVFLAGTPTSLLDVVSSLVLVMGVPALCASILLLLWPKRAASAVIYFPSVYIACSYTTKALSLLTATARPIYGVGVLDYLIRLPVDFVGLLVVTGAAAMWGMVRAVSSLGGTDASASRTPLTAREQRIAPIVFVSSIAMWILGTVGMSVLYASVWAQTWSFIENPTEWRGVDSIEYVLPSGQRIQSYGALRTGELPQGQRVAIAFLVGAGGERLDGAQLHVVQRVETRSGVVIATLPDRPRFVVLTEREVKTLLRVGADRGTIQELIRDSRD